MAETIYKNVNGKQIKLTKEELQEFYQNQITEDQKLRIAQQIKISELEKYFDSEETKKISIIINDSRYRIVNNSENRNLFLAKMVILQAQIESGLITESEAKFSFQNGDEVIEITLPQIKQIVFTLDQKRQSQFYNKETSRKSILSLTQKESIENYKFDE